MSAFTFRNFDRAAFLRDYWQKRPLLIRFVLVIEFSFQVFENRFSIGGHIEALSQISQRRTEPAQHLQIGQNGVTDARILHLDSN